MCICVCGYVCVHLLKESEHPAGNKRSEIWLQTLHSHFKLHCFYHKRWDSAWWLYEITVQQWPGPRGAGDFPSGRLCLTSRLSARDMCSISRSAVTHYDLN